MSSLCLAPILPLPLVEPGLVPLVDQSQHPQGPHLPAPDPIEADPLVMVVILHFKTLTDVATAVAAVSAIGEQNVGALEVGAELEEVRAVPLLQPEHHEEGVQVSAILGAAIAHLEINDLLRPPWRYPA